MCCCWQWGVNKGGRALTKSSRGLEGKPHSPNSFHYSAAKQQLPLRLCWGETDSNYSFLFLSFPLSFSQLGESHSMGNREKGTKTSPPPLSYFLRKRHLLPALGEMVIVYFEWCAIMTVQQIRVTRVCGKWWNFWVIPCKLLILSGEVATQRHAAHLLHTLTWQLHCCAKTFDSLLYFGYVKKTLGLSVSQIQKLIWDHCRVSCTSTVMAWPDCVAVKHRRALLPIECLIYNMLSVSHICCSR